MSDRQPIGDANDGIIVSSIIFPDSHFGQLWVKFFPGDNIELWMWELVQLTPVREENLLVGNGAAYSYKEAFDTLCSVMSIWQASGDTLKDLRERNKASQNPVIEVEEERLEIGFVKSPHGRRSSTL